MLMNKLLDLFAEIRPNAVALVDAFDYPDQVLNSCLGRYDGRVYEALWDYCQQSPMNEKDVSKLSLSFHVISYYLRGLMHRIATLNPNKQQHMSNIWAASWQNQQMTFVPSEDPEQPGHPPSLIRLFAGRMKRHWVLSYWWEHCEDSADTQVDLSLHWAHRSFCWCCHEAAQL